MGAAEEAPSRPAMELRRGRGGGGVLRDFVTVAPRQPGCGGRRRRIQNVREAVTIHVLVCTVHTNMRKSATRLR